MNYTWTITSVDAEAGTMIVTYEMGDKSFPLNVPQPPAGEDVGGWVAKFAPAAPAPVLETVVEGQTGSGTLAPPSPTPSSLTEDYLKSLIRAVLAEPAP